MLARKLYLLVFNANKYFDYKASFSIGVAVLIDWYFVVQFEIIIGVLIWFSDVNWGLFLDLYLALVFFHL